MNCTPSNSPVYINILNEYHICSTCGRFGKHRIYIVKNLREDFLCSYRCYAAFQKIKKEKEVTKNA